MATYSVGSGGTYATLQTCFAAGVLADGDTVQLAAGYNVNETCSISGVNNITLLGDVTDPAQAVVTWDNATATNYGYTLKLNNLTGWVIKGITLNYTGTSSVTAGCFFGGWSESLISVEDCRINTSGRYAFSYYSNGTSFHRCEMAGTTSTATNCQALGATKTLSIESCMFRDFGHYQVQLADGSTVVNSTFYNGRAAADCSTGHAIYTHATATLRNVLLWNNHTKANRRGIVSNYPSQVTVSNSIIWGSASADGGLYDLHSSTVQSNVLTSADVGSSAVLADAPGGNFYPDAGGLADGGGSATYTPTGGDLNRQPFNSPPSIGALEILPAPTFSVEPSPVPGYVSGVFCAQNATAATCYTAVGSYNETWTSAELGNTHATAWEIAASFCQWFNASARPWSGVTATASTRRLSAGQFSAVISFDSTALVFGNGTWAAIMGFGLVLGTEAGGATPAAASFSALVEIENRAQPTPAGGGGLSSGGGWVVGDHPTAQKNRQARAILTPQEMIAMAAALDAAENPRAASVYDTSSKQFHRVRLGAIDAQRSGNLYTMTAAVSVGS